MSLYVSLHVLVAMFYYMCIYWDCLLFLAVGLFA